MHMHMHMHTYKYTYTHTDTHTHTHTYTMYSVEFANCFDVVVIIIVISSAPIVSFIHVALLALGQSNFAPVPMK